MSIRPLPRSRLRNLVPTLVDSQALVALIPATGDLRWAAEAAWDVARAAAQGERRVALVDLWLEEPKLHEVVGLTPNDGIVDAFEYGLSLTKAARQVGSVFFIPAGTYTPSAGELFGHPRWPKLQAGFRSEGALLLLYLSAGGVERLSATPDGLLVLSPEGFTLESPIGPEIAAVLERGAALLGVVRERWTPAPGAVPGLEAPARVLFPPALPQEPGQPPWRRASAAAAALALVVAGASMWALWVRRPERPPRAVASAPTPPANQTSVVALTRPVAAAESLAWTVQLAAYGALEPALADADELAATEVGAFVTPLALEGAGGTGTVWYRVLVGSYGTREAAAAARAALWRRGATPRGQGLLVRAPYSFEISAGGDFDSLRRRGIPVVRAGRRMLVGAFETPEQASLAEAQLQREQIHATLITRVGGDTTP